MNCLLTYFNTPEHTSVQMSALRSWPSVHTSPHSHERAGPWSYMTSNATQALTSHSCLPGSPCISCLLECHRENAKSGFSNHPRHWRRELMESMNLNTERDLNKWGTGAWRAPPCLIWTISALYAAKCSHTYCHSEIQMPMSPHLEDSHIRANQ